MSGCAATEICERMGSLGLQRNLVTYFTKKMHLSNPKAANMVSNFVGALYLTPFIGGFVADAYWGRFWAIAAFASIQVVVSSSCECTDDHRVVENVADSLFMVAGDGFVDSFGCIAVVETGAVPSELLACVPIRELVATGGPLLGTLPDRAWKRWNQAERFLHGR